MAGNLRPQTDGKALVISLHGTSTRFVRLALKGKSYFHLDEVEIFAIGDGKNIALVRKPNGPSRRAALR